MTRVTSGSWAYSAKIAGAPSGAGGRNRSRGVSTSSWLLRDRNTAQDVNAGRQTYNDVPMFQSERFFRESWPTISQAVGSPEDAARSVRWILGRAGVAAGARVLDAPCGFGRHSVEFARRGFQVTGVDFNETEIARAREAATRAGVTLTLLCQDMRDMDFSGEFDLAVNLFSSIGYFSDDEDRLLLDRFWRALRPGGVFVLDTRNRDQVVRSMPPEDRLQADGGTVRIENRFDPTTSRWAARWWRVPAGAAEDDPGALVGESEIRLYAAHELRAMLRPERWSRVDLFGALDGTPFSVDAYRLVLVARK
ncbi:MAG: SAM-dependent methyltransferase [Candidatus Rokuibacteriota bacterium]